MASACSRLLREELLSSCSRVDIVLRNNLPSPLVLRKLQGPVSISTLCTSTDAPACAKSVAPKTCQRVSIRHLQSCRSKIQRLELRDCGLAANDGLDLISLIDPHRECRTCDTCVRPDEGWTDRNHQSRVDQDEPSRCEGSRECCAPIGRVCILEELDIGCNEIGAIPAVFTAIGSLSGLRVLRLANNKVGPKGCGLLSHALASSASNGSLCVLDVSSNDVADEGITYLASVLAVLSVLTDLCVSHNGIGDRGVKALCRGLEQSTTMHELDLRSNVITDDGERFVSAMLRRRIPLLRVDLCHNRIGPEGDNWCF